MKRVVVGVVNTPERGYWRIIAGWVLIIVIFNAIAVMFTRHLLSLPRFWVEFWPLIPVGNFIGYGLLVTKLTPKGYNFNRRTQARWLEKKLAVGSLITVLFWAIGQTGIVCRPEQGRRDSLLHAPATETVPATSPTSDSMVAASTTC